MAAEAARAIDFHFMGYYPITPSTEIAQLLDSMKARGEISTVLLPADGEHGAAGACFGASTAGARVLNATSANGFLYSLEQLPVQAGSRLPMVLNLVTRSVSGPLDIRCDHSDLMFALQTGWIILLASTPQAVYDMNIIAVRLGEHPEVRLPVMVVSDGFFTSHQRQSVRIFDDVQVVRDFLGPLRTERTSVDPRKPITIGPYMNDADLLNNKYQLHRAHEAALRVYDGLVAEYATLSGRLYPSVEFHQMADARSALFLLNSAAETAKDAVDSARNRGEAVGLIRPNIVRPFPVRVLQDAVRDLKSIVIGERSDTPGSSGGPLSHEVRSSMLSEHRSDLKALIRVYGLGGRKFKVSDAESLIEAGLCAIKPDCQVPDFDFLGVEQGEPRALPPRVLPPMSRESLAAGLSRVEKLAAPVGKKRLHVVTADPGRLVARPKRIAPGHGACPGCGIFSGLDQFFKGIEGDCVVLYHTGCAMVVTTEYPFSAHRVTYLHNLFQNGAPTLAGLLETFHEKKRRGEVPASEDITFIMVTGDGGMDIGMGPTLGTAVRNHRMILLEYDNQGYMNTGGQLSYSTPLGKETATSHAGVTSSGKAFHHRDTPAIMAAAGARYVFTAIEGIGTDMVAKAAKAQWYAKHEGFAYGKILVACPVNWSSAEEKGFDILRKAVESCFFPLYEIEHGLTTLSEDPEAGGRKVPVSEWLEMMGKSRHLLHEQARPILDEFQREIDRRWAVLRARAAHPML